MTGHIAGTETETDLDTSSSESFGRLFSRIYRYTHIFVGKELEQYNIGSGQFSFLIALHHNEGATQERLAHLLHVDKATSARAVKKLVKEGYVKREKDVKDKRKYRIFLTEKGKKMEPVLKEISAKWTAVLLFGFTEDEKDKIRLLLKKMVDNASAKTRGIT